MQIVLEHRTSGETWYSSHRTVNPLPRPPSVRAIAELVLAILRGDDEARKILAERGKRTLPGYTGRYWIVFTKSDMGAFARFIRGGFSRESVLERLAAARSLVAEKSPKRAPTVELVPADLPFWSRAIPSGRLLEGPETLPAFRFVP